MRRIKPGDRVKVTGYERSARKYGYATRMEEMVGKTFSSAKSKDDDAECIFINGIFMSNQDVEFIDDTKEPEPQIFLFDESIIEGVSNHGQETRGKTG